MSFQIMQKEKKKLPLNTIGTVVGGVGGAIVGGPAGAMAGASLGGMAGSMAGSLTDKGDGGSIAVPNTDALTRRRDDLASKQSQIVDAQKAAAQLPVDQQAAVGPVLDQTSEAIRRRMMGMGGGY